MSDIVKAATIQAGVQQQMQQQATADPNLEMITNSIFVDDSSLKAILKGEVDTLLNEERRTHTGLRALVVECAKNKMIDSAQVAEIQYCLKEAERCWRKVDDQLAHYKRMVPYLILLSPLTRLSNLTPKEVNHICLQIDIMIGRDKLMSSGEDDNYGDANFWDSLGLGCKLAVHDSAGGWKFKGLTINTTMLHHSFQDGYPGQPTKKKRFGIF